MKILAIDRSTDMPSVALAADGDIFSCTFADDEVRRADWPMKIECLLEERRLSFCDLDRIVVGMGPGSFAGIRGALAFAQGVAIGICAKRSEGVPGAVVYGLPSAIALARDGDMTAVVGDARRGLFWVVIYEGVCTVADLHLVSRDELFAAVPPKATVVTPDGARIGDMLEGMFGFRFAGSRAPSADRMAHLAIAHPDILVPEPLPIYLSPAVRA